MRLMIWPRKSLCPLSLFHHMLPGRWDLVSVADSDVLSDVILWPRLS